MPTGMSLPSFGSATTKLRRLYLAGSFRSDGGLAHLKGLTKLSELSLSNNQVSDAGLAHLKG
jgi:Leucine-rich repeat (LRR) protein